MQVSPRRLLPQEAVPGRGKVRGTHSGPAGEPQRPAVVQAERTGQLLVLLVGLFLTLFGASGACASQSSGWRSGVWEIGSGRAQPQPLSLQTPLLWAGEDPEPAAGSFARISCCRRLPGLQAVHGSCLAALTHLPPGHRPVPPAHTGAPLAFYKGAKKNSQTTLKSTFCSARCLQRLPGCLHLLVLESPLQKKLFPAGAEWGTWAGGNAAAKRKTKRAGRASCVWVCMGGLYTAHLLRLSLYHIPVLTAGEQTSCLT